MSSSVTIGIPVYKRLRYLPHALRSVAAQDHEDIELLVSDNGGHGEALKSIVEEHYPRPFRIRRNPSSVGIVEHYNQIVDAARGRYFALLADDDELGPGAVSSLAGVLDREPDVGAALARLEVVDDAGERVPDAERGKPPPPRLTGDEFVRIWCEDEYRFVCFSTFLARTAEIRTVGAYPPFPKGTSVDNALLVTLTLGRRVAFVADVVFRYRVYETSHGLSLSWRDLAIDLRRFIEFLDRNPTLRAYARREPRAWRDARDRLIRMTWRTYRSRWKQMYRSRLSSREWIGAAFAMPMIPGYYNSVLRTLVRSGLSAAKRRLMLTSQAGSNK